MADDKDKTYSADEHLAILQDRVQRETADLAAERDQLQTAKADLESKLDVAETAKTAAEQARATAEQALADFKAEVEQREAAALKKDERVAKVREVAKHLDDKFFEDEARITRIVAMSDESFEGYVADMADASKTAGNTKTQTVPRETAMQGDKATGTEPVAGAGRSFLMRPYVVPTTKEG